MFFAPASTRRPSATASPQSPITLVPTALRRILLSVGLLAAMLTPLAARAQNPGDLDSAFTSALVGGDFYALTLEVQGSVQYLFVAGDAGLSQRLLATTGEVDNSFGLEDFGLPTQRIIYTAVQEQVLTPPYFYPKVLIGGLFGRDAAQIAAQESGQNIKRFVPSDGALDPTFNPGTGANDFVTSILPLTDGTILVGGEFTLFNKVAHERIVKLDNSGAIVDGSVFSSNLAFDATVLSLAQQYTPDGSGTFNGQILAAGTFGNVNGKTHTKLARFNADGSVDDAFNPVFSDRVRIVVSQPDGKILAGGDFETVNGSAVKHLVRLNYDGSVDTTFNCQVTEMPPQIDTPVAVNTITPLGDGRYYIGGAFYKINGVPRHYLARVLADGTVDGFDPGATLSNVVQQVVINPLSNEVFVAQSRDKSVNGIYPASVFRLFGDPVPAPSVTVTAPISRAKRKASGEFLFTRVARDTSAALTVTVSLGGTAALKSSGGAGDYQFQPALATATPVNGVARFSVTFAANETTAAVFVRPTKTSTGLSSVELTVQPDPTGSGAYTVGSASSANVTIVRPVPPAG